MSAGTESRGRRRHACSTPTPARRVIGRRNAAALGAPADPARADAWRPGRWTPPAAARSAPGRSRSPCSTACSTRTPEPVLGPGDVIAPWGVGVGGLHAGAAGRDRDAPTSTPLRAWPAMQRRGVLGPRRRARGAPPATGHARGATARAAVAGRSALGHVREAGIALPRRARRARVEPVARRRGERGRPGAGGAARRWRRRDPRRRAVAPRRSAAAAAATARRDALRTRAAVQLALARAACADCAELCDDLDLVLARRDALRAQARLRRPPPSSCRRGSAHRARRFPAPAAARRQGR